MPICECVKHICLILSFILYSPHHPFLLNMGKKIFQSSYSRGWFKNIVWHGCKNDRKRLLDDIFVRFGELCQTCGIPKRRYFKYSKRRHLIWYKYKLVASEAHLSSLENLTIENLKSVKFIRGHHSFVRDKWTKKRKNTVSWQKLKSSRQSAKTRMKRLQYKWLMKIYITPQNLCCLSPGISDACWKCSEENSIMFHWVFDCSELKKYCCSDYIWYC